MTGDRPPLMPLPPPEPTVTTVATVRGLPVLVHNTRPDVDTGDVLRRLDEALGLIERYVPHHFRRLRRDPHDPPRTIRDALERAIARILRRVDPVPGEEPAPGDAPGAPAR